ncbi:MAG: extracellular solute-binding protein, partial [Clostridia bacterium]|nr:extracellular solute-binding protein [Clostridia bacterium]
DNMMIQSLKQLNAPYSTPTGQVEIFNDTTRWILDEVAKHADSRAFSTFAKDGYPGNYFNAGRCIFAVDSTAGATWMGSHAPLLEIHSSQVADFETVVRPVPQYDPENPAMISQGPSICIFNKEDPQIVLASWIFMQYLLTNDVQVSYSKTEGYVPVTTKAVNSPEYKDYMSRSGEDYNEHYYVKLDAAKIVIDNVENSFVTNVFNGSASLREAAGELIEMVNKEVRYGVTIDDDYYPEMYSKVSALKHLDEIGKFDGKAELGPLPKDSIIMLAVIGAAWVVMGTIVLVKLIRKKKDNLDI